MSRKSYQKITLSVELTLLPGLKPKDAELLVKKLIEEAAVRGSLTRPAQSIIKITKRETIYTN